MQKSITIAAGVLLAWAITAQAQTETPPKREPSGLAFAVAMEESIEAAIAKSERSVVAIARVRIGDRNEQAVLEPRLGPFGVEMGAPIPQPGDADFVPTEFGTGVIVDREGLVLTNYHVLGDNPANSRFFVTTNDRKIHAATIKAADERSDLAILSCTSMSGAVPITFGDGGAVKKGQIVIALGNPYAIARDGQASATWGIISNLQRKAAKAADEAAGSSKPTLHHFGTLIQTDARLNLGTSGGALLNLQGEMIGLTTSMAAVAGYEQPAGYAIPVDETFKRIIDTLKRGKSVAFGFLGIHQPDGRLENSLGGGRGVRVTGVVAGTPAAKAGLQAQNDVIVGVDGQPVYDFDSLMVRIGGHAPGSTIRVSLERGGTPAQATVRLAKYPNGGRQIVTEVDPAWRGLRVDFWTAASDMRARAEGPNPATDTVVVTEVAKDSAAYNAKLSTGSLITHVDNQRVTTPVEFSSAVAGKNGPVKLRLRSVSPASPGEVIVANE